ncbi:MAG: hypothetical protein PHQ35_02750 [Phycisphaerae bacterium]|nr:hypothetical protein [Phycisphaerae bacterium]MDD5380788.1 hypothetical protein [Phycisphaerae bacterium]
MKKRRIDVMAKNTKCFLIVLSFAMTCVLNGLSNADDTDFKTVDSNKIPRILSMLASTTQANFEKIHTWQGELDCSRYYVFKGDIAKETFETSTDANGSCPNEVAEITENRIVFKCDLDKGLWHVKRSREAPSRYIDPATNKDLGTKSLPSSSSEITTKEYQYNAQPDAYNRNDEVARRKAVKTKIDGSLYQGRQPNYLPRYIFDIDSQAWNGYPKDANIIEEKGKYVISGLEMKAEQRILSGDLQYRIYEPFETNAFNIKKGWFINTFSEKAGFNIIDREMMTADGKLMLRKSTEYQKVNGVYVPIRYTKDRYDFNSDFSLREHEEGVFKNIFINDTILEETFTYKNLGLQNGDKFIDEIAGKECKYQDANLVFVADVNK